MRSPSADFPAPEIFPSPLPTAPARTLPSGGTGEGDTYYWIFIWSDKAGADIYHIEGHFNCLPTPTPTPPPPHEGCTPGFWKNHPAAWLQTPHRPDHDFDAMFGTNYFTPDITLGTAIGLGGGGVNRLARHGTAALLNATHSGVNYPYTAAQVITLVQAGNADAPEAANELGCPLR